MHTDQTDRTKTLVLLISGERTLAVYTLKPLRKISHSEFFRTWPD